MSTPTTPPVTQGSSIDLTTLASVKSRVGNLDNNTNADSDIAAAITAFSRYVLTRTGIQSFTAPVSMDETRDGNGNDTMFVRTPPVINVAAVVVNGVGVPQAGAWPMAGWYLSNDARAIKLRGVYLGSSRSGYSAFGIRANRQMVRGFPVGQGNVELVYTGGYASVPEDLEYAVRCVVAINYKRASWQDMASKTIGAGGAGSATTRYRDWAWPPEYEEVFEYYTRKAVVG